MCLAIPGKIVSIDEGKEGSETALWERTGRVSFGGILKEVSLACVPEAKVGDYVIVHVGLAISIVDAEEARKTLQYVEQMEEQTELNHAR